MSVVLTAEDLTVGYPGVDVARGIHLQLQAGRLVCLLGPNGAGKSTLLRTLCAMQAPRAGRVLLNGADIHRLSAQELAKRLAVVLTERVSPGLLSAYELVSLGRYPYTGWSGRLSANDHRVIQESIELAGASDLAHRQVTELSDGERQKVMLARALAQEPSLMVLDEITAFLDLPRRVDVMRTLRQLAHAHGRTILLSTHDLDLALRSADELWLLEKGGQLHRGAPEDLVLNGTFASAFRSEGLEFDRMAGYFHLEQAPADTVAVTAEGEDRIWACRAAERAGFRVVDSGALTIGREQNEWVLAGKSAVERHAALGTLVDALRAAKRVDAPVR